MDNINLKKGLRSTIWLCSYFILFGCLTDNLSFAEQLPKDTNTLTARILLSSSNKTVLSSQIAGQIKKISVKTGEHFKKGQTLIKIHCEIQQAQREKARAELLTARTKYNVQKQLQQLNSGSALEIKLAAANIKRALADLSIIDIGLKMCLIKAPFSGQVVERKVEPFQYVSVGESILEIIDNKHLQINLIVPSKWLAWLKTGQVFSMRLDDNQKTYQASVVRIGAQIDSASQSLNIIGKISGQAPELIAGMSGTAVFQAAKQQ